MSRDCCRFPKACSAGSDPGYTVETVRGDDWYEPEAAPSDLISQLRAVCDKAEPMRPAIAECGHLLGDPYQPEAQIRCRKPAGHRSPHHPSAALDLPSLLCVPVQDVLAVLDGSTGLICPTGPVTPQPDGSQSGNDPAVDPDSYHAGYQARPGGRARREDIALTVPTPGPPVFRPDWPRCVAEANCWGEERRCELPAGHEPLPHRSVGFDWPAGAALRVRYPDRRAALLDAIAQASITIQRSVAELEQMGDEPVRWACGVVHPSEPSVRCLKPAGHLGVHQAGEGAARWANPSADLIEQRYCGHVAQATGVEVKCDRTAGHPGPHRRGELGWPNAAPPSSLCLAYHPRVLGTRCELPQNHLGPHRTCTGPVITWAL